MPEDDDRTGRARIRDAAIARFAAQGVKATSLKAIAEDAGVSPPLVAHHFGSKDGLRAACDAYVVATIREGKRRALLEGVRVDALTLLRQVEGSLPLMRYLARTLADGTPQVAAIVDELVEDAVAYTAEGVAAGLIKPSDHPRERVVVLTIWSLGALVLHEHLARLLGADITADAAGMATYMKHAGEVLAKGVLDEKRGAELLSALAEEPRKEDEP
jgi:AcrR family transcriptional regulator